jgi:hypothetical protein
LAGRLTVAKSDAALGQIVRREFQRDFIAREHANAIAAQPPGKMRQYNSFVFELNAEQSARKFFENGSRNFNAVFFAHSTSLRNCAAKQNRAAAVLTAQALLNAAI